MGHEGSFSRKRFVDVRIVRSKTGHAILKGCAFYNWTLNRDLRRLSKDVIDEINSINYRMRLVSNQSARRMKRSEKLVKTYDLPPLKPKQVNVTPSSGKERNVLENSSGSLKQTDGKRADTVNSSLGQSTHSLLSREGKDFRKMLCSPAPRPSFETDSDDQIIALSEDKSNFPHIKVDKCEEKLPPVGKPVQGPPEYTQRRPERSASSNSLEVPFQTQQKRNQDGKCVTILTPSFQSNYSNSEGNIINAIDNESQDGFDRGASSILKPLTISCGSSRSSSRSQTTNNLTTKRVASRSLSPRPRLTNRTQATPTLIVKGSNSSK